MCLTLVSCCFVRQMALESNVVLGLSARWRQHQMKRQGYPLDGVASSVMMSETNILSQPNGFLDFFGIYDNDLSRQCLVESVNVRKLPYRLSKTREYEKDGRSKRQNIEILLQVTRLTQLTYENSTCLMQRNGETLRNGTRLTHRLS